MFWGSTHAEPSSNPGEPAGSRSSGEWVAGLNSPVATAACAAAAAGGGGGGDPSQAAAAATLGGAKAPPVLPPRPSGVAPTRMPGGGGGVPAAPVGSSPRPPTRRAERDLASALACAYRMVLTSLAVTTYS